MNSYERQSLRSSDSQNRLPLVSKLNSNNNRQPNLTFLRGKQNECRNNIEGLNKNLPPNHSFEGYFNGNMQKITNNNKMIISNNKKDSMVNRLNFSKALQQSSKCNKTNWSNRGNFLSSRKLSNCHFIQNQQDTLQSSLEQKLIQMHEQVQAFMNKFFPDIIEGSQSQLHNIEQQYVSISDFVQILFEEFQTLLGNEEASQQLMEGFSNKIFLMFGQSIYFVDLFERTLQNGLTGLILDIVKAINEDKNTISLISPKNLVNNNIKKSSNVHGNNLSKLKNTLNEQETSRFNSFQNAENSRIQLNKYFGNNNVSSHFIKNNNIEYGTTDVDNESTLFMDDNLQEVKRILQTYMQSMYEQASIELNKKYSQQMRKITSKYKEASGLLQKINEKVSQNYDFIQYQKLQQNKIQQYQQKQAQMEGKIKIMQLELKHEKQEREKEQLLNKKMEEQLKKMREKLQKYENAIFQKAMVNNVDHMNNNSNSHTLGSSNISSNGSSRIAMVNEDRQVSPIKKVIYTTVTTGGVNAISSNINSNLSPIRGRESYGALSRVSSGSISPIRQRISFVKTHQQPSVVNNTNTNNNISVMNTNNNNSNIKCSEITVGERVQLRPLSPIRKMTQTHTTLTVSRLTNNNNSNNNNAISHPNNNNHKANVNANSLNPTENKLSHLTIETANRPNTLVDNNVNKYQYRMVHKSPGPNQLTVSPVKVQFCTSQVVPVSTVTTTVNTK